MFWDLVIFFLWLTGLPFFPYLFLQEQLQISAKYEYWEKPAALFYSALGTIIGYLLIGGGLYLFLSIALAYILNYLALLPSVVGYGGWIVLGVADFKRWNRNRKLRKANPLPKLQLWMQDLYLFAFCFGISMALLFGFEGKVKVKSHDVIVYAVYLMLAQGFSFFAAMDVCRRSESLKKPLPRGLFLFTVLVYGTFLLIPLWMAWAAWRKAIFRATLAQNARSMLIPEEQVRGS